jgi:hypothetical protein
MMLSNINRAEGCEKGKASWGCRRRRGKNNATPSASQLPRDEAADRGALVKQKRAVPQANGFLILSLSLALACVLALVQHTHTGGGQEMAKRLLFAGARGVLANAEFSASTLQAISSSTRAR